jgi:predicted lysophospholipase L1 biosynthesis ABC-type transport system permease subunit
VRIVGLAVLPPGDVSAHLGDGVIVTRQALVRLAGGRVRSPYVMAVTFRPGTDTATATARLDRRLAAVDQNFFTQAPAKPTDLVNFGRIQDLPLILGGLLAVMVLITVAHLLATSIRRRRRDLAILKTLGFTQRDVGWAVAWHATTLAVITLLALVVPAAIGLANLISIGPAVTAMRTRPASVLREQ